MKPKLFMAYGHQPEITRETLSTAARLIKSAGMVEASTWEDLKIGGRVIVTQVLSAIDEATICGFDVSTLNENVLFELGYAIARKKLVRLLLDRTDTDALTRWKQFELLKGVGYTGWANSDDIRTALLRDYPFDSEATLFDDLIEPALTPTVPGSIFYVPTYHPTDASKVISRRLDQELQRGVRLMSADPTESALNTLDWFASKAYECECVIVHFEAARRELSSLHNPRSALVAGLAVGFERPLLMLSEHDYAAPLDYGAMLRVYRSAKESRGFVDTWLRDRDLQPRSGARTQRVRLATELRTLRFGEHVAENEIDALSDYFVETAAFEDVIAQRNALFVGRKGTGKTANMLQAAARLSEDVRNLVVVIKPPSYEFSSLLTLLGSVSGGMQQYSIVSLWRFLLSSEIANRVVDAVESRPSVIPYTEDERKLLDFVESAPFRLRDDFGTRFEKTVAVLETLNLPSLSSEAEGRDLLNEALHSQAITKLRALLGPVLRHRHRVAVLIDNLDKGWDRSADLDMLAHLLLGLLAATGRVATDFAKEDYWRNRVSLTVATFLRSDIFGYIQTVAREPDKIQASRVTWADPQVLLRIVEERFLAARPADTDANELWTRFVCQSVDGVPTRQYLLARVLPRPRDLIFFCNAAVAVAANRAHEKIEEADILEAERAYSQFAFEALLVENGITITQLKNVLLEFLGEPAIMDESTVSGFITRSGIGPDKVGQVLERLKEMSFLGVEVGSGRFDFPESGTAMERARVLARKLCDESGAAARLQVHAAFRAYLEIAEPLATR